MDGAGATDISGQRAVLPPWARFQEERVIVSRADRLNQMIKVLVLMIQLPARRSLYSAFRHKRAQSQERFSPTLTTRTPLADALFMLPNRAILPVTVYRNLSHTWAKLPQTYFAAQVP